MDDHLAPTNARDLCRAKAEYETNLLLLQSSIVRAGNIIVRAS
jgi:hypothetical protein